MLPFQTYDTNEFKRYISTLTNFPSHKKSANRIAYKFKQYGVGHQEYVSLDIKCNFLFDNCKMLEKDGINYNIELQTFNEQFDISLRKTSNFIY